MDRVYLGLDLGDGDGKVDGGSEARYGQTTRRCAPANSVPVPDVIALIVHTDQVNAVQPVVFILPRLLSHSQTGDSSLVRKGTSPNSAKIIREIVGVKGWE